MAVITLVTAAMIALLAGFAVAWSGLYNVAATTGHWAVTHWFLTVTMRNSVETHALGLTAPPLDDDAQVSLGLGHYQGACQPCHGAPGESSNLVARQMLPSPPYLPDTVGDWSPEGLFWVVKHGLKYTGMPAWPAQTRDDEVWAVVAALRRLPGLDAASYRRLTRGPSQTGAAAAELMVRTGPAGGDLLACVRCHGLDGGGGGAGAFPRLAGQSEVYLAAALQAYAVGSRASGVMQPIAAALDRDQIARLAAYYAAAPGGNATEPPPAADGARGAEIASGRRDGLPACAACHGPGTAPRHPLYPALAGQHRPYLEQQLRLYRQGGQSWSPAGQVMTAAVHRLEDADLAAVAAYYAALPTAPP